MSLSAVVVLRWDQGSVSLASFPPAVSWPGASFPPRGPSGRFPRFTGTTRRSESPPTLPPHFVAFVWRYPGRTRGSLPQPPGAPAAGLELVTRCSRRDSPRRWRGLPGSWRTPALVPCSPTPAGSQAPGRCGAATRPSVNLTTSAPAMITLSGLNRTARSLAVYASQIGLPRYHARLASGRWPSSAGRGWLPAGSQRKVSAYSFPLSQAFPGALSFHLGSSCVSGTSVQSIQSGTIIRFCSSIDGTRFSGNHTERRTKDDAEHSEPD
jgi:hypothetical protein